MFNTNKLRVLSAKTGILGMMKYLNTKRYFSQMNKQYQQYKKTGKIPLPERYIFDLTFKCNLHCKMCYINFPSMWKKRTIDNKLELTAEEIKTIFDKIPKLTHVTLIGGEIFARRDMFEILDYFASRGTLLRLSTNLTMLNDEQIEQLKKYKNIEAIGTSIDGDREIHNNIRDPHRREAFDITINTMKKLKDHFFLGVLSVILDDNLEDLPKVVDISKDAGAHILTFEFERRYTEDTIQRSADSLGFTPADFPLALVDQELPKRPKEDFEQAMNKVIQRGKEVGLPVAFLPILFKEQLDKYFYRKLDTEHFCKQLFIGRIDAQGNVVHCFAIRKPFGNLLQQSYEDIWNSEEYTSFRNKMEKTILPICETCEKLVECKGGKKIQPFNEMVSEQNTGKKPEEHLIQVVQPRAPAGKIHNLPD